MNSGLGFLILIPKLSFREINFILGFDLLFLYNIYMLSFLTYAYLAHMLCVVFYLLSLLYENHKLEI